MTKQEYTAGIDKEDLRRLLDEARYGVPGERSEVEVLISRLSSRGTFASDIEEAADALHKRVQQLISRASKEDGIRLRRLCIRIRSAIRQSVNKKKYQAYKKAVNAEFEKARNRLQSRHGIRGEDIEDGNSQEKNGQNHPGTDGNGRAEGIMAHEAPVEPRQPTEGKGEADNNIDQDFGVAVGGLANDLPAFVKRGLDRFVASQYREFLCFVTEYVGEKHSSGEVRGLQRLGQSVRDAVRDTVDAAAVLHFASLEEIKNGLVASLGVEFPNTIPPEIAGLYRQWFVDFCRAEFEGFTIDSLFDCLAENQIAEPELGREEVRRLLMPNKCQHGNSAVTREEIEWLREKNPRGRRKRKKWKARAHAYAKALNDRFNGGMNLRNEETIEKMLRYIRKGKCEGMEVIGTAAPAVSVAPEEPAPVVPAVETATVVVGGGQEEGFPVAEKSEAIEKSAIEIKHRLEVTPEEMQSPAGEKEVAEEKEEEVAPEIIEPEEVVVEEATVPTMPIADERGVELNEAASLQELLHLRAGLITRVLEVSKALNPPVEQFCTIEEDTQSLEQDLIHLEEQVHSCTNRIQESRVKYLAQKIVRTSELKRKCSSEIAEMRSALEQGKQLLEEHRSLTVEIQQWEERWLAAQQKALEIKRTAESAVRELTRLKDTLFGAEPKGLLGAGLGSVLESPRVPDEVYEYEQKIEQALSLLSEDFQTVREDHAIICSNQADYKNYAIDDVVQEVERALNMIDQQEKPVGQSPTPESEVPKEIGTPEAGTAQEETLAANPETPLQQTAAELEKEEGGYCVSKKIVVVAQYGSGQKKKEIPLYELQRRIICILGYNRKTSKPNAAQGETLSRILHFWEETYGKPVPTPAQVREALDAIAFQYKDQEVHSRAPSRKDRQVDALIVRYRKKGGRSGVFAYLSNDNTFEAIGRFPQELQDDDVAERIILLKQREQQSYTRKRGIMSAFFEWAAQSHISLDREQLETEANRLFAPIADERPDDMQSTIRYCVEKVLRQHSETKKAPPKQ